MKELDFSLLAITLCSAIVVVASSQPAEAMTVKEWWLVVGEWA